MRHKLSLYTSTGHRKIFCRGRRELGAARTDGIPFVESSLGNVFCGYPIAISDGKEFLILHTHPIEHYRRGKAACPNCGYVTTFTPKML